jgi:ABC-type polysaccharide/polyol phosphate transport system ATPase subunit
MTDNVIEVEGLSKRYALGQDAEGWSLRDRLASLAGVAGGAGRDWIWSLHDVSFTVPEGGSLGVIGRNGSGKTTLLKILSRITEPTMGVSRTRGRVGSLLEVGAGFHHELTGRENVYLSGAILGLQAREVTRRFDEIVDFAGVARFIDTPVKRYSSGMYLRLAFAVAAHIACDVLLVDEVLAVGDAEFQRKCVGSVHALGRSGRTVVFVSHDLDVVAQLCRRTLWLDEGEVRAIGPTPEVIDQYLTSGVHRAASRTFDPVWDGPVALESVAILDAHGNVAGTVRRDEPFGVELAFTIHDPVPGLEVTVSLSNLVGTRVVDELVADSSGSLPGRPGRYRARATVPPLLSAGDYSLSVWAGTSYDEDFVVEDDVLTFEVTGVARSSKVVELGLQWEVQWEPAETRR